MQIIRTLYMKVLNNSYREVDVISIRHHVLQDLKN